MPICLRARLVMWNSPRPCTGMVMRMPPIITCVTMEKIMPASNSSDTADIINFKPGNTNT